MDKGLRFWAPAVLLLLYNIGRGILTFIIAPMRDEEERSGYSPALKPTSLKETYTLYWQIAASEGKEVSKCNPWHCAKIARRWLLGHLEAYGWLIWPHRVIEFFMLAAIASFLLNAWIWLTMPVWLPA